MHGTISLKEYICILSQIFTTLAVSTTDRRNGLGGREGGREGEASTNYLCPAIWKGVRKATIMPMFLSFSVPALFVDLLTNPLISSPSHSVTDNSSLRFNAKSFRRSAPGWEGGGQFFPPWSPNPFSEALRTVITSPCFESLSAFLFLTQRH